MFYMAHRYQQYGLVLFAKQIKLLHKWHLADLPTDAERQRNDKIEVLQGNRNLFVHNPELLNQLVVDKFFNVNR